MTPVRENVDVSVRLNRRLAFARVALLAAALVACAASRAAAQTGAAAGDGPQFEHGFTDFYRAPWSLPTATTAVEAAELNARWKALGEELRSTESEFAGTYTAEGAMRSSYLRWAPSGGFVYLYVYEHLSVIDFSYGKVSVTPTAVFFAVERERKSGEGGVNESGRTPPRWVPARWKLLNYLVPEGRVADFGRYVAGFGVYNDFNGPCCEFAPFLTSGPKAAAQASFDDPVIPAPYARLMRRPVEATVRFVGRRRVVKSYGLEGELYSQSFGRASLTPVRIDAGRGRGARPGMLFRIVGAPQGQYLKIVRVRAAYSEGVLIRQVDEDGSETFYEFETSPDEPRQRPYPPVKVGARVTTSPAVY